MRALLVYPKPDNNKNARFGFSYEQLTIATVLNSYYEVTIKDYSCEEYDEQWVVEKTRCGYFDVLLIECDSFALKRSQNIKHAKEIISLVKNHVPIIAYGNYCYITNKDFDNADFTIKTNDINSLITQINSLSSTINHVPAIPTFDDLPYIDRGLLLSSDYHRQNRQSTLIQTSKGCDNTCTFCQRKGWQNKFVTHSDEYILGEFKYLKERGYLNVWIVDENFTFNLPRAKSLLRKLYQEYLTSDMKIFISSWANIDREFIDLAALCNIRIISFGIESANNEILAFYRKNIKLDKASEMIQYANRKGIFTVGNFILGAPMETERTIEKTFSFIRDCQFDQINIKILDYMIGSELFNTLPDWLKSSDHVFASAENGLTSMTIKNMISKKDNFQKEYYTEHKGIIAEKVTQFGVPYALMKQS